MIGITPVAATDSSHVAALVARARQHERPGSGEGRAAAAEVTAFIVQPVVAQIVVEDVDGAVAPDDGRRRDDALVAPRRSRAPATPRAPLSSERTSWTGLPGPVNFSVPTSAACSQVMYTRAGLTGSAARRTWKVSSPATLIGSDSVRPPSSDVDSHDGMRDVAEAAERHEGHVQRAVRRERHVGREALGLLALGRGDRCLRPARLRRSAETCSAHEKNGVSMRLETARLAGRTGLRTSVGELWALTSSDCSADRFTGRSLPPGGPSGRDRTSPRRRSRRAHEQQRNAEDDRRQRAPPPWRSGLVVSGFGGEELVSGRTGLGRHLPLGRRCGGGRR